MGTHKLFILARNHDDCHTHNVLSILSTTHCEKLAGFACKHKLKRHTQ
jgi:hypothetical protein